MADHQAEADDESSSSLSTPLLQIIQNRSDDDESLISEADSEENTESELNLGWKYTTTESDNNNNGIGDSKNESQSPHDVDKVKIVELTTKEGEYKNDDDIDDSLDQLKDIFYMLVPNEITQLIFRRLDLLSKHACRLVCQRWHDLVDFGDILVWHPELHDDSYQALLKFGQKKYPSVSLEVYKLSSFEYPVKGLGIKLQRIEFNAVSNSMNVPPEPRCNLGISNLNLNKLLFEYRSVQEMILNSRAFNLVELPSPFRTTDFCNLSDLELSTSNADGKGYYVVLDALENVFSKLKTLKIRLLYHRETIFLQHPPFYKEVFQFFVKHAKTLNNISLSYCNLADERSIPPFVFDLDHSIPARTYQNLMSGLEKVQLSDFSFNPTFYEGRARFLLGVQLMNYQNQLTNLKLGNLSRPNFVVWESTLELIRRCKLTLKSIQLDGCFCPEARPLDQFSCSIIQSSKNLEILQIAICGLKITDVELLPPNVTKLHLGRGLSRAQITYISENLTRLIEWYLPQDRAQFDRTIPKTSIAIFKSAVKLPKLQKLILTKRCSSWKRIRKIISYTQGLDVAERETGSELTDAAYYVTILIDRKRLELDRL